MKFAAKLAILVLSIVICSAVFISSLVYFSNVRTLQEQITNKLEFRAAIAIDIVDRFMYEREIDLKSFSVRLSYVLGDPNPDKIKQDLINYRNENKNYISLSFLDLDGKRIADTSGIDVDQRHSVFVNSKYWNDTVKGKSSSGQLVEYSYSLGVPVIFFAYPVYVKDRIVGILVARVATSKLYEITRLAMGKDNNAMYLKIDLINSDGLLIYSNYNRRGILKDKSGHYSIFGEDVVAGRCRINKNNFEVIAKEKGYLDFMGNGWKVILAVPEKIVFAPANQLRNRMIGLFIFAVFLSLIIILFFSHYFSQPIIKLSWAVAQISSGNLNIQMAVSSKDEIGQLAASFNAMVKSLKKAREELVSAKDYTDSIIASMVDCLVVISHTATIKGVNKALCDLLGYQENELVGQPIKKIFVQEEEEEEEEEILHKYFNKIFDEGVVHNIGLTFFTKQGSKIPINFSGSLMRHNKEIVGIVGVARDMRQIMAVIKDLEDKRNDLEEHDRELTRMQMAMLHIMNDLQDAAHIKTQFTGMVSHELRTPLASIKEGISLVLDKITGEINDEQVKYLTIAKNNVDRLDRLIVAVLDFQKLESGKMDFKMESNDINEIVKSVENTMRPLFNKKGLFFELHLSNNLPQVEFDRDMIVEVLTNLVNNAYKFTDSGGVNISTKPDSGFIKVMVKDTGIGINKEDISKLFQEFTQLSRGKGGAGLGLSICKKIIEAHKGKIWVETDADGGTAFYFTLPIKEQRA